MLHMSASRDFGLERHHKSACALHQLVQHLQAH
jgi:hypothetical protein